MDFICVLEVQLAEVNLDDFGLDNWALLMVSHLPETYPRVLIGSIFE